MSEYDGLISHVFRSWDYDDFTSRKKNMADAWTNDNISEQEERQLIALLVAHAPEVNISE